MTSAGQPLLQWTSGSVLQSVECQAGGISNGTVEHLTSKALGSKSR